MRNPNLHHANSWIRLHIVLCIDNMKLFGAEFRIPAIRFVVKIGQSTKKRIKIGFRA